MNQCYSQYSTGLSRHNIEQALIADGKDLDHLQPADLGQLEDFHTMGRIATSELADLAQIRSQDEVLDAGSGIGGTARFLADHYRCRVATIDLTEEYCETARWLNRLVGLEDRISVRQGDVTDLPFADATFHVVTSQHVQMNVADKALRKLGMSPEVLQVAGFASSKACASGPPEKLGRGPHGDCELLRREGARGKASPSMTSRSSSRRCAAWPAGHENVRGPPLSAGPHRSASRSSRRSWRRRAAIRPGYAGKA